MKCYVLLFQWVLLFSLSNSILIAQNIEVSGTVVSQDDNQPIPYAHITVKNRSIGAVSDLDGNFSLSLDSGEESVLISAVGFNTVEIPVDSSWRKKVMLRPLTQELNEVVVVGERLSITAKDLVTKALKKASKIDKNKPLTLNISETGSSSGRLTRSLKHEGVSITRKESIPFSIVERSKNGVSEYFESGTVPVGWHLRTPYELLSGDIYTVPKLGKSKGKFSFTISDVTTVKGKETFEVSVTQIADTISDNWSHKTDRKFYFRTDNYELIRYESRNLLIINEDFYRMTSLKSTVAEYNQSLADPLTNIKVQTIQHLDKLNKYGVVIGKDRGEVITIGSIQPIREDDLTSNMSKALSASDILNSKFNEDKLYMIIYWKEASFLFEMNKVLFDLIAKYPNNELEIVCVGNPSKKSSWVLESQNWPFLTHLFLDKKIEENGTIQLFREEDLLITKVNSSPDSVFKLINRIIGKK